MPRPTIRTALGGAPPLFMGMKRWGSSSPVLCPVCNSMFRSRWEMRNHYLGCSKEYPRGGFWCEECDRRVMYRTKESHESGPTHKGCLKSRDMPVPFWCRDCESLVKRKDRASHCSTQRHFRRRWRRCLACRIRIRRVNLESHRLTAGHASKQKRLERRRRRR